MCAGFAETMKIANSTATSTEFIPAGTTITFPNANPTCGQPQQLVTAPLCRVQANIATSANSSLRFEAWLPQNWTGRFLGTGNSGLGGCIQYADVEWAASLGFAAVGTSNSHDGASGAAFLNNPEVLEDFVYRAVLTGARVGKTVTQDFYGRAHTKSYHLGCSTGGRQGLKMVQDFSDLFDGVSAGAPAVSFNNLNTWSAHFLVLTGTNTSDTFVSRELWSVVHQDVLDKCDALDGSKDGILEAPDLCRYKADDLLCGGPGAKNAPPPNCLTAKQLGTVNAVFSEMRATDGAALYPRMQPGPELDAFDVYYTGLPSPYLDWIRYVVMADPNFDVYNFTPDLWTNPTLNPFGARSFNATSALSATAAARCCSTTAPWTRSSAATSARGTTRRSRDPWAAPPRASSTTSSACSASRAWGTAAGGPGRTSSETCARGSPETWEPSTTACS